MNITALDKKSIQPTTNPQCFHCGDLCGNNPIVHHDKSFCCEGCQTVYDILQGNELCQYYELEKSPGAGKQKQVAIDLSILDSEEIVQSLLTFTDGQIGKAIFFIPAIHCSSCIWLLENLHKIHQGVIQVQVNFPKKEAAITFRQESISLKNLVGLLSKLGYAPDINLASGSDKTRKGRKTDKRFIIQLGVAGFCFGNIMMLSIPEYLDYGDTIDPAFRHFFSYLNILLALPVFLYSSQGYFIAAWKGITQRYLNIDIPIALGILTLFGRSAYEIITGIGPGFMDSLAGLVFFLLIGKWFQGKTYQALSFDRDYESYFPIGITRLEDDREVSVPLKDIRVGDRLLIRNQELIPADATLVEGKANIDYSFVTGESAPVKKSPGDLLYAGGRQMGTSIEVLTKKQVNNSYLTQLWNQDQFQKQKHSLMSSLALALGKRFTIGILLVSLATAVYWYFADPSMVVHTVTSVLIVACPCALALTIPFTLGNSLRIFGKNHFFLKNTDAIEKMAKVDTIVFDKTGTLTVANRFQVGFEGEALTDFEASLVKSVTRHSTHPLSQAITAHLAQTEGQLPISSFLEYQGKGIEAILEGLTLRLGSAAFTGATTQSDANSTRVYVAIEGTVRGHFTFAAHYREGLENMLATLQSGYDLHVLSGDQAHERKHLSPLFPTEHLHFNQSPVQKLEYVESLQKQGKKVMMLGDGLNDAGALKHSDLGVSIAEDVYHFSPACDAILDARTFARLPQLLTFSKRSIQVVKASFVLSFLYNIVGLSYAITGIFTPLVCAILMPLSSITVVGFVTLATNLLAPKGETGR
jgi:Cu+-exporting ATPase